GGHHEIDGAWRGQLEFDGVFVARIDLADRPEQRCARDADAGRWFRDAVEGRFYVSRREIRPVVELDTLAQVKRVGLAVLGDFPAMRQIGDDGLATVARITPDQVVKHAALSADVADRARLMHVEMRGAIENECRSASPLLALDWAPVPPSETSSRRTPSEYRRRSRCVGPNRKPPSTRLRYHEAYRGGAHWYARDA